MNTIFFRILRAPRALLVALAIGLIIRTIFVSLHVRPLISDEREYDRLAFNLAAQRSYTYDVVPTAYRPIGYPALVGAVFVAAGHDPIAVKFLQVLIDGGTGLLLFLLLAPRSRRAALLATFSWSLFPPAILFTNFLMSESVFTFLFLLTIFLLCRAGPKQYTALLALGLLIGILTLMKPGAFLLALVPILLLHTLRLSSRMIGVLLFGLAAAVAPWVIRNFVTFGTFSLSSNGGINLLIGNHPDATGGYNLSFDTSILEGTTNEFEADARARRVAWEFIKNNPGEFAVNAIKKAAHFFESEGGLLVWAFHPSPEEKSVRFATKYGQIPLLLSVLTNLPYMLILILGFLGFVSSTKDELWWIVLASATIWIGIHLVYFGGARFHFPLMPVATAYAALAFFTPFSTFGKLSRYRMIVWSLTVLLLLSLWTYEVVIVVTA